MKRLLIATLGLMVAATAQTAPTFKGHRIGESLQEFLSVPVGEYSGQRVALADCHGDDKQIKRAAHALKRSSRDVNAECSSMLHVEEGGAGMIGIAPGADAALDFENMAQFADHRLVSLTFRVFLLGSPAGQVLEDISSKLGKPLRSGVSIYQNGFGAKFEFPSAYWESNGIAASLEQTDRDFVLVTVVDAKWHEKQPRTERTNTTD